MESELLAEDQAEELCQRLGYQFRDISLLLNALCHASFSNEQPQLELENNERLEFLGDAVLELAVSHILMDRFAQAEEGTLSRYRAALVDETGLYQVAMAIGLGKYIFLGKGEELSGGREKPSILADAMEALIGAVYIDGGFDQAKRVIIKLFSSRIEDLGNKDMIHDFKSLLQELTQQRYKTIPAYRLVEEWGPPHDKVFRVSLAIRGEVVAHGEGKSKKEAEQRAAKVAYMKMRKE
ncbi:MAG: ribonuclease III [Deltaproteobacteria bacterium]|nr:ribonuclease III [Deltaproteobacteria bacterium]MBW1928209.1 ribonuclease III [Deltaproteobacteria bacterium]MBW2024344.1 ribonuclease III [Deltaproteobacteria bacterium]MBW2124641.1 ribonuclease III [Deltaproteobacteria bacterium]